MGCKFTREREAPSSAGQSRSNGDGSAKAKEPAQLKSSMKNTTRPDNATPQTPPSPYSPSKHPFNNDLGPSDSVAIEVDGDEHYSPTTRKQLVVPVDVSSNHSNNSNEGEGGSGVDLSGSFAHADLNGSFHIQYNTKGDIIPNATAPDGRRARSVSPKLLAALSPHPSDDELVLLCTDCGQTIDEECNVLCPLTGKLHV